MIDIVSQTQYIRAVGFKHYAASTVMTRDSGDSAHIHRLRKSRGKGCNQSFGRNPRDEVLNRVIFKTMLKAEILIEVSGNECNVTEPHLARGYGPPPPVAWVQNSMMTCIANSLKPLCNDSPKPHRSDPPHGATQLQDVAK